ncbi:MAG: DUF2815 family protein [Bacteroidales bacterium]|nr:DUF2815 family protein [Candidatus Cryptobacteroides faecihippi]
MNTQETKVVVGEIRLSYVHVFEPVAVGNSADKKYSVSLIIPKSNTKLVEETKAAIKAAYTDGITSKWQGKEPAKGTWKNPLRDGDIERSEDEAYQGAYFLNATSKTAPGVVKMNPTGNPKYVAITAQEELYSGCFGYVSVNFYPFVNTGNKGVACGLNNVLKTRDGEFMGGRASAESDFNGLEINANLDDNDIF